VLLIAVPASVYLWVRFDWRLSLVCYGLSVVGAALLGALGITRAERTRRRAE
jgi:uncharacterized integral membrane protein